MPKYPDWKNSATDAVLRLLDDSGVALSPGGITVNLEVRLQRPPSRSTVTRAVKGALDVGLIERAEEGRSYYQISEQGRAYLAGDIEGDELGVDQPDI